MRAYGNRVYLVVLLNCLTAAAADWNQWRGPRGNGLVDQSPALLESWPAEGPKKLWVGEDKIPSNEMSGGFGSLVVADGRVYCPFIAAHNEKLTTRTLSEKKLIDLGWTAKKPSEELLAAADAARLSAEREALKTPAAVQAWIQKWLEAHLPADQKKEFALFLNNRLRQGQEGIDLALLDKIAATKNKPFENQEALDAWFTANGVADPVRKTLQALFPDKASFRDTAILCLDSATGKTLWEKTFLGSEPPTGYPASGTPCVVNGKCYLSGSEKSVFCLDAKTGEIVWKNRAGDGKEQNHCSFVVVDGVAILPAGPLTGFDAQTGQVLWTNEKLGNSWASAVCWQNDDKTYAIVRASAALTAVDPHTGKALWSIKDGGSEQMYFGSTPVVAGDRMAVAGRTGVGVYTLSLEKAELAWEVKCPVDLCCPPTVFDGHVYIFGHTGSTCMDLGSGRIAWQEKNLTASSYFAPLFADGKAIMQGYDKMKNANFGDGSLLLLNLSPEKPKSLAVAKIGQSLCTTPALCDGRLYCRMANAGVTCFDLRKK